ncbi:MAG TPA: sigma-70 family RNA polymerase sigma factor [Blastocatellia bacterium]|nr:sigma-70 family RNA polymerase sigma factor [Blastocatellia bacterium]
MSATVQNVPGGGANLVSRIQIGDQHAETELVERFKHVVMSVIRRKVGDISIASDLYQETFCIVIEKIRQGDLREQEKLPGFICGVARNRVIKYFQRAMQQGPRAESDETVSLPHPASDQLEELLRKEKANLVRQVLMEMTHERDIQVLSRFYLAEESKELICADLGLTSQQFRLVLHRARERYRELYELAMRRKR